MILLAARAGIHIDNERYAVIPSTHQKKSALHFDPGRFFQYTHCQISPVKKYEKGKSIM